MDGVYMVRRFKVMNGYNGACIGELKYSSVAGYSIELDVEQGRNYIGVEQFISDTAKGKIKICGKRAHEWIAERVISEKSDNLDMVLKQLGMERYSEIEILRRTRGESPKDKIYLMEIEEPVKIVPSRLIETKTAVIGAVVVYFAALLINI